MTHARELLYGAAVGDALGVPYEFKARDTFTCDGMVGFGTHGMPPGTWSDDTSMLLATFESLKVCGRVDVDDMRERFLAWIYEGAYTPDGIVFDVGSATARALEAGHGMSGEWDNGNGSLMRILPLALTTASDEEIRAASAVTHAHEISMNACVEMVHFARELIAGNPEWPELPHVRSEVESSGFVLHTQTAALWCLRRAGSYASCVRLAVNLGHDTDTTACVAGGLAGLRFGYDDIPKEWIATLRGKDLIESLLEG